MSGALTGLKVIEIAGLGPTPSCGMLLGDMGAEVVRVDRIVKSDLGIDIPTRFNLRDRNKKSIALDLKQPDGIETLLKLVEKADVLIEGFRPGVAERLGFGPAACEARNPSLVYARATGWGQSGPYSSHAGHDINYVALTGALDLIGPKGGDPAVPLNLLGDYAGGATYLAFGIMCAVFESRQSGRGQVVDGAILDGVSGLLTMFHAMRQSGELEPERGMNLLDGGAPFYTTYRTRDGKHIAVGALEDRFYQTLASRLGLEPENLPDRMDRSNWPELRRIFEEIFAQRTRDEWSAHFETVPDACFSPVLTIGEAASHPHNAARQMLVDFGGVQHPQPAPRLSRTPGSIASQPPVPGNNTAEVLKDWGIEARTIEDGIRRGIFYDAAPG
ncbi:CaiB/BaiF CoA-transferase family protein [Hyphomonas sp. ND6WE1B]|uniref:CaiB/BaiF CoA transferase family protein n=1 Tax=Hyphomonas sp. ND6WE1B TaxID=1848191 RepID=UPI000807658A|nr:CaiB/BaiF CoA-transferase family protein [Hyphomonas sp. ND6WE1B]